MNQLKKQILGVCGLAAVLGMTAFAASLPSSTASATGTEATTQIVVEVHERSATTISKPTDGTTSVSPTLDVAVNYSDTSRLTYYLSYEGGEEQVIREYCPYLSAVCPAGSKSDQLLNGTDSFALDLDEYSGFGDYVLRVKTTGNSTAAEDSVAFHYYPVNPTYIGTDANLDPMFSAEVASTVARLAVQAYDQNGNPLFAAPVQFPVPSDYATSGFQLTLPFADNGAASGDYKIAFTAYDADGTALYGPQTLNISYEAPSIAVPDTGFLSIAGLNLSRADYLIAGLVGFAMIVGFALFLIARQKRQSK